MSSYLLLIKIIQISNLFRKVFVKDLKNLFNQILKLSKITQKNFPVIKNPSPLKLLNFKADCHHYINLSLDLLIG
jgi:hypothetical protein